MRRRPQDVSENLAKRRILPNIVGRKYGASSRPLSLRAMVVDLACFPRTGACRTNRGWAILNFSTCWPVRPRI